MLGNGHTSTRDNKADSGRNVIGVGAIATRAHNINRTRGRGNPRHCRAHGADGTNDFINAFTPRPQCGEETRHQGGTGLAAKHFGEGALYVLC